MAAGTAKKKDAQRISGTRVSKKEAATKKSGKEAGKKRIKNRLINPLSTGQRLYNRFKY